MAARNQQLSAVRGQSKSCVSLFPASQNCAFGGSRASSCAQAPCVQKRGLGGAAGDYADSECILDPKVEVERVGHANLSNRHKSAEGLPSSREGNRLEKGKLASENSAGASGVKVKFKTGTA